MNLINIQIFCKISYPKTIQILEQRKLFSPSLIQVIIISTSFDRVNVLQVQFCFSYNVFFSPKHPHYFFFASYTLIWFHGSKTLQIRDANYFELLLMLESGSLVSLLQRSWPNRVIIATETLETAKTSLGMSSRGRRALA